MVASSSVWPSGGAVFTAMVPITPLAPGRLSTTTGWPVRSSTCRPISRAVMSPEPPGAKGTMMRTGRVGQACARAAGDAAAARPAAQPAASSAPRRVAVGAPRNLTIGASIPLGPSFPAFPATDNSP